MLTKLIFGHFPVCLAYIAQSLIKRMKTTAEKEKRIVSDFAQNETNEENRKLPHIGGRPEVKSIFEKKSKLVCFVINNHIPIGFITTLGGFSTLNA